MNKFSLFLLFFILLVSCKENIRKNTTVISNKEETKRDMGDKSDSVFIEYDKDNILRILSSSQDTLLNLPTIDLRYSYTDDPYFFEYNDNKFVVIYNFNGGSSNLSELLAYRLNQKKVFYERIRVIPATSLINHNNMKIRLPQDIFLYKGESIDITSDGKIMFELPLFTNPMQRVYYKTLKGQYKVQIQSGEYVLAPFDFNLEK